MRRGFGVESSADYLEISPFFRQAEVHFCACYGVGEADFGGLEHESRVWFSAVESVADNRGV